MNREGLTELAMTETSLKTRHIGDVHRPVSVRIYHYLTTPVDFLIKFSDSRRCLHFCLNGLVLPRTRGSSARLGFIRESDVGCRTRWQGTGESQKVPVGALKGRQFYSDGRYQGSQRYILSRRLILVHDHRKEREFRKR